MWCGWRFVWCYLVDCDDCIVGMGFWLGILGFVVKFEVWCVLFVVGCFLLIGVCGG